ncbi:EscU/YscU/HrcU family type III secretion system export apparatus switch protein [Microbacterium protaetiae]|uniref:EscU/YscU/HrcU family type III secretion system export apparatus switch protein n=1 Tax=Microbacterium protaetiae TaxID=2509458 RepID=A0A4V0YDA8_9MICO|nr:EscU/YscU/HrcU family type III secretion system export apparatus switch protein [Microbacterium protaetiae]QAY60061.1 EscU/YscU/HrcU family type III secretion system export apparatus switch protein [Microbacterium protaetiae]
MSDTDSGERTEKASDRRLREARQKGKLARSQDLTAWLSIGAAALCMPAAIAVGASAGSEQLIALTAVVHDPTPATALTILGRGLGSVPATLGPLLATVAVVTVVGATMQGGVHLRRLSGRVEQFNIVSGVARLFGGRALWEGAKALLKTAAIAVVVWLVIAGLMPVLQASGSHSIALLLQTAGQGSSTLLQATVAVGLALAAIDVFVVMRRNAKHTRMTKREVKDENKNSEGDPLVRQQRRSRQFALSRNRMITAVADADVVVVNPTHIAVALRYQVGRSAPRVVAKGSGVIAERIREKATDAGVPLVRDIPLARALNAACALGQEIPEDLYTAVAQVLVFVDALRRRGSARGIHSLPPRRTA